MGVSPGASPGAFTIWVWAIRPRTLPLAASAIVLGYGLARMHGTASVPVFVLALVTAILLQVLSNLANDYGDAAKGTDTAERLGPTRMVGSGLTTARTMFRAMLLSAALALISGSALVLIAAWRNPPLLLFFVCLGASCIAAAIFYTVGKRPYGYYGLGDFMAGFFFGPVPVWGTAVLCAAPLHMVTPAIFPPDFFGAGLFLPDLFLPGLAAGFCSTMVLNVNNMRDMETDEKSGKRTVAVRLGRARARVYHATLSAGTVLCWTAFWLMHNTAYLPSLVLCLPLIGSVAKAITDTTNAAAMNRQLKNTVLASALLNAGMGLLCGV
ncbi:MAG: 1,4-dihydroxy-2-naphthoate octaprenyltransferase [Desulfovibrio sp.]